MVYKVKFKFIVFIVLHLLSNRQYGEVENFSNSNIMVNVSWMVLCHFNFSNPDVNEPDFQEKR